jgi:hypothetical protein
MRSVSSLVLATLLIFAGAPSPVTALPPETDITGKILDADGVTPIQDVFVRLKNRAGDAIFESGPADGSGQYRISNVPDGDYSIIVITPEGEFELPNRLNIMGGQPSTVTVILTPAASWAARKDDPAGGSHRNKAAVLIPVIGSIFVAAFAAAEYFESDGDGSPKLP